MGFISGFRERRGHLDAIHREGVLGKWLGGIWIAVGAVSFGKTEFLSLQQQEEWQFIHMIPAISIATWVAIFVLLLFFWAIEASFQHAKKNRQLYATAQAKIRDLDEALIKASSSNTTLQVKVRQKDRAGMRIHELGVINQGRVVAKNVKVSLQDIYPKPPSDGLFRNLFPYRVVKADASWSVHSTIEYEDVDINPNHEEELFHIAISYPLQGQFYILGLDTKKNGDSHGLFTAQGQGWLLLYEVNSTNADPIKLTLTAVADSDGVIIQERPNTP